MKKVLFPIILFILFLLSPVHTYALESIKEFNTAIAIQENGQINVTEIIVYDFGSEERRGIIRDIPYIYIQIMKGKSTN